jgi:xylulokinase
MKSLIGVDIGTQGTKAALFAEDGSLLAQAFCPSKLHQPRPGVVEEDPEVQFQSVCRVIRQCVKSAKINNTAIAGIGIDGQMAGVIGIGKDGQHVTHYDSWLDTRCSPYIREMEQVAGKEIIRQAGCAPSFNHGPKMLWWMREQKRIYRSIAAFVQPGGYAAMRLCGLTGSKSFIDRSYLHFSGFADNAKSRWDEELCRCFDFDPAKLPAIVEPTSVVGALTADASRKCGLKPNVPVVAGCGDTEASFLACGAIAEGIGVDVAGTASVFAMTTANFQPDTTHRILACGQSSVPGLWRSYAYVNGGGMNLEWFLSEIAHGGKKRGNNSITLAQLNDMAAAIEPSENLPWFVPHMSGRVCPPQPELRGAWIGLSWRHTLAHLYRAMMEGVALEYAIYEKALRRLCKRMKINELRVTGGGRQSDAWNQIKADVLQIPLRMVSRSEGAPLGVAMLAGCGVGVLKNLPEATRSWITLADTVHPRPTLASLYTSRVTTYETFLKRLSLSSY